MATKLDADRIRKLLLGGKAGFASELARARAREAAQREAAAGILAPETIANSDVTAAKLLLTTLGGNLRPITRDDLQAFAAKAKQLGKRFKGGITAQGVIDFSRQIDRDRASEEIRVAVPVRSHNGTMHFLTNAGKYGVKEGISRHHVTVEFPAFKAFAVSPTDPKKLARGMLDGPLRFDCDCGRHRYWYRYIASAGGFAAGRLEPGFPKIRNPKLEGIGCKHVLRVMTAVRKDPTVLGRAAEMILHAQRGVTRAKPVTAAEARQAIERQVKNANAIRNRIETTQGRQQRLAAAAPDNARKRAMAKAAAAARAKALAELQASRAAMQAAVAKVIAAPMTKAARDALIAQLMAIKTVD